MARTLRRTLRTTGGPQEPTTAQQWTALCSAAMAAAAKIEDPRALGLARALEQRQEERVLRALGIICDADIQRLFVRTR